MLVASYLQPVAKEVIFGDEKTAFQQQFLKNIDSIDASEFADKRVVVKGCGDLPNRGVCLYGNHKETTSGCKKHHVWGTLQYGAYL